MNCTEAENLVDAYVDGELELLKSLEVEAHLRDCPACARLRANHLALRDVLAPLYEPAPAALARRIRRSARPPRARLAGRWAWGLASAALAAIAALLLLGQVDDLPWTAHRPALAREAVSAHIRSLMAAHLTDVASSDQHTVKPWFNGKLDFSPPVKNLAAQGFPLVGGRLDYLGGHPVAALVYARHKHLINVFVWPAGSASNPARAEGSQGYNVLHWTRAGMAWWAVSDLNRAELAEFTRLLD